jgi:hypothetical protein
MQFTISALALIAAAATVQASCVPIITCGMKRGIDAPHTPASVIEARAAGDDFSNAFAGCLNKDHAQIVAKGATSFTIKGKGANAFHDCDAIVNIYQKTGMTHGKLVKAADGSFEFTPLAADLPAWSAAVKSAAGKSA